MVLIILDEIHDNYVLFTVGPTLYFLHSESLTALDLKPGETQHLLTVTVLLHEDAHIRRRELREKTLKKAFHLLCSSTFPRVYLFAVTSLC